MSRAGGREEDSREGEGGWGAVVAAARAGLNEPSHSLAALTVRQGRRCEEAGVLVATVCLSLSRSGGAVFISIG